MTRIVGLTGAIGTGKSTVAKMLASLGAEVVDADALAREAVLPKSDGLRKIVECFGPEVLLPDGSLDRAHLAERVFSDATSKRQLEAIVHPVVHALAMAKIKAFCDAGAAVVVYDVPLLFEAGLDALFSTIVVVVVPPELQRARITKRDGLLAPQIDQRIASQMPLSEKERRATYVIDNSGDEKATMAQVKKLWDALVGGRP